MPGMFEEQPGDQCLWSEVARGKVGRAETLDGIGQSGQVGSCKSCQGLHSSSE